jgi:predicted nucleotidyltransferase
MSRTEIEKIIKQYGEKLRSQDFDFEAIYFFGSHAKNKSNKWSDIDIAVISDQLSKNKEENYLKLWDYRLDVDTRLEPHGFTISEFKNNLDPFVSEIKSHGVKMM